MAQIAAEYIRSKAGKETPALAIVLGSGLGDLASQVQEAVSIPFENLEGFPVSGVSGHSGALICGYLGGARVILLSGRAHYYEHGDAAAMKTPLQTLAALGCTTIALSNAAGSTREHMPPGTLMALEDHLSWSGPNPLIGMQGDKRFVDLTDAYDPELRVLMQNVATRKGITLESGVYAWFSGPTFETPAEIRAVRQLGADAVGMSTVPETILARYFDMRVTAVSAITNYAAGMSDVALSHAQTKAQADRIKDRFVDLITGFAAEFAG